MSQVQGTATAAAAVAMRTKRTDVTLIEHERSGLVTAQVTDTSRAPAKRVQQLTNHQQQRYTYTHTHTHTHTTQTTLIKWKVPTDLRQPDLMLYRQSLKTFLLSQSDQRAV